MLAVKSSKKYIENGKRALSHIKTLIKHVFRLFYLHELLMYFEQCFEVIYTERESVLYHAIKTPRRVLKNEAAGRGF